MIMSQPTGAPSATILLVDDEPWVRSVIARLLGSQSYSVIEVSTAEEALAAARQRRPDLVVTDVLMPGTDGYEFVRKLRSDSSLSAMPVIMCSGALIDDQARALAERHGVQGFWDKTSSASLLFDLVGAAIQGRRPAVVAPLHRGLEADSERLMAGTLLKTLTALEASEERFMLLLESVKDYAIFLLNPDGTVASWNTGAHRLFGYDAGEIRGRHVSMFCLPEDLGRGEPERSLKTAATAGRHESEGWRVRKDGTVFWASAVITAAHDRGGELRGFAAVIRDMTPQKRAKEELDDLLARLRALSQRMERIREEERARIAREIHDQLGQALTALKMDLTHLEESLSRGRRDLSTQCRPMHEIIDQTIKVVQNISGELRLGHLHELGLGAAVEWQLQEFQRRTGIRCELERSGAVDDVEEGRATAAYRILQEALTNVARHSQATTVKVNVFREGNGLVVEVRDNGRGITPQQLADSRSFGLLGMHERAQALGGDVAVTRIEPHGTAVVLVLPLVPRA